MYVKYNAVLRGAKSTIGVMIKAFADLCRGNYYTSTLNVVNSAIVKLNKLTRAEPVFRGISGGVLPPEFWTSNELLLRGGVEGGFMSTTLDRAVALAYAGSLPSRAGVIFEIQQGLVDRGADIGWLSQCAAVSPFANLVLM